MSTIYFYVPSSELNDTLKYGIKLSKSFSHTIPINGIEKKCLVGLLNPKDDLQKFNSEEYACVKIDIKPEYCFIINDVALVIPPTNYRTINLKKYTYGDIESPRVLFSTSILPEQISALNKTIDEPLLFDNSRDLFYQLKINKMLDELPPSEVYLALCEYFDYKKNENNKNTEQ